MQRLTGKIEWVTGSVSGIGEAGALALAEEGASVMLTGRRREPLEAVAARIAKQGGTARVHPGDMSCSEDASAIAGRRSKRNLAASTSWSTTRGPTFPDRSWKRLSPAGVEDLYPLEPVEHIPWLARGVADHAQAEGRRDHQHRLDPRGALSARSLVSAILPRSTGSLR